MFQWEDKDSDFIHGEAAATDKTKFKHNKVYEHRPCVSTTSDRAMARAWNVEDMFSSPAFFLKNNPAVLYSKPQELPQALATRHVFTQTPARFAK